MYASTIYTPANDGNLSISQHSIVSKVMLGDKNNINIVHEVFRQVCITYPYTLLCFTPIY